MRIEFESIVVSEGAIIPATIFNNLLGILSKPVSFLSSIFLKDLRQYPYSKYAEKTICQWFPEKIQDLLLPWKEYLLLVLAQYHSTAFVNSFRCVYRITNYFIISFDFKDIVRLAAVTGG